MFPCASGFPVVTVVDRRLFLYDEMPLRSLMPGYIEKIVSIAVVRIIDHSLLHRMQ